MVRPCQPALRLDIFAFAKGSLSTQIAGIGLIIMAAGGFASYMDHIKASNAMVNVCIRPLQIIKAPYVIGAGIYLRAAAARRDFQRRRIGDDVIGDVLSCAGAAGCE